MQDSAPPSWLVNVGLALVGAVIGFLGAFWKFAKERGKLEEKVEAQGKAIGEIKHELQEMSQVVYRLDGRHQHGEDH